MSCAATYFVILGRIADGDKRIRTVEKISCTACKKSVPGGITVSASIYGTAQHRQMLKEFKRTYLCGRCRDAARISKSMHK